MQAESARRAKSARRVENRRTRAAFGVRLLLNQGLDAARLPLTADLLPLYRIIQRWHYRMLGSVSRIREVRTFNQRMHWLMLFDQDPQKTILSDKLHVKDAATALLGEGSVVPVLQVADSFDRLRLEGLPKAFVLKTNHDSGGVQLVRDVAAWDQSKSREFFERRLSRPYGVNKGEWQYQGIQRRIFVEELIDDGRGETPDDFKLHCVDGEVGFVQRISERASGGTETILDAEGQDLRIHLDQNFRRIAAAPLPKNWPQMIEVARLLSRGFKYVRVDLYDVNGRVLVGELTFTPKAGCYPGQGQEQLGGLIGFGTS